MFKKSKEEKELQKVEEIRKVLEESGDDVDPEVVARMYMPKARTSGLAAALMGLDKLKWIALLLVAAVAVVFFFSMFQQKSGNFTISLNKQELARKGLSIAEDRNFTNPTTKLDATSIKNASNITGTDIPANVNEVDGSHNGSDYMAFTYYIRNAGQEKTDYKATVSLVDASKGAEKAIRVAVYRNGDQIVYAEPATGGGAESGTTAFVNHDQVCEYDVKDFDVGYVDKYTVVMWLEGNDPDCTDNIIGGTMKFKMDIDGSDDTETSAITRLFDDVVDTLFGSSSNKTIDNATLQNVTWDTRRNR